MAREINCPVTRQRRKDYCCGRWLTMLKKKQNKKNSKKKKNGKLAKTRERMSKSFTKPHASLFKRKKKITVGKLNKK